MIKISKANMVIISWLSVFPVTYIVFDLISISIVDDMRVRYFGSLIFYWLYCLLFIATLIPVKKILIVSRLDSILVIALIPAFSVLVLKSDAIISGVTSHILLFALVSAVINGVIEEIFWRGAYLHYFKSKPIIGGLLSIMCFGLWHLSLLRIQGIDYGGEYLLVVSSTGMGGLWAYCAWKKKSVTHTILAHVITNFFAFSNLYIENRF